MTPDPKRLLDDPAVAPSLRDAIAGAKQDGPEEQQAQALLASLGAIVDRPVAVPSAPAAGLGAGAKLGIGLSVIALVGGGLLYGMRPKTPDPVLETVAPTVSVLGERTVEDSPAVTPPPSTTIDLDDIAVTARPHTSSSAAPVASGPSEVALLDQARASLASNPTRALALTEEHRRRFPKGALSQEREVIAIEALKKLGRGSEAKKRGDAFSAENPDTIHRRTVTETKK